MNLHNTRTKPVNTVFGGILGGQNAPDSGMKAARPDSALDWKGVFGGFISVVMQISLQHSS